MLPCPSVALSVASRLAHSAVDMMHSAACSNTRNDDAGPMKHKAKRGRSGGESQPTRMVGTAWRMTIRISLGQSSIKRYVKEKRDSMAYNMIDR
jgi:hypothetical protein